MALVTECASRYDVSRSKRDISVGGPKRFSRFTREIYARLPTAPVTYRLKDLADDVIKGKFYESEIQKVVKDDNDYFDVEKILKTRRRGGKIEYLV